MLRYFTPLIAVFAIASSAAAAETAWQELAPDVRIRLIADEKRDAAGQTHVALEVDMPASYKTYWRVPGDSGIPTQIDWTGSQGVASGHMLWPFPVRETLNGLTDYVYHGPTVLPIALSVDTDSVQLAASVVMGICSDICMPATASFELSIDFTAPDPGQGLRISQAMAETPIEWDATAPEIRFDTDRNGLVVTASDPALDLSSIIASGDDPVPLFGSPQKSPEQTAVFLPILGKGAEKGLDEKPIHLTFMTDNGPYELSYRRRGQVWAAVSENE